jgi:hypothetical protein
MHLVRAEVGNDSGTASWKQVAAIYRCWLYEEGRERRHETGQFVIKHGSDAEAVVAKQKTTIILLDCSEIACSYWQSS